MATLYWRGPLNQVMVNITNNKIQHCVLHVDENIEYSGIPPNLSFCKLKVEFRKTDLCEFSQLVCGQSP